MKKRSQILLGCMFCIYALSAQGLVVENGPGVATGGHAIFGKPFGTHLALGQKEVQAKTDNDSFGTLFLNYYGGSISMVQGANGGPANVLMGTSESNLGYMESFRTLFVKGDTERVGIGTPDPDSKLTVAEGDISVIDGGLKVNDIAPSLQLFTSDGATSLGQFYSILGSLGIQNQFTGVTADIIMTTEEGNFRIENDGKIGIGINNVQADVHLKQSFTSLSGTTGMRFEVSNTTDSWQVMNSGAHFSFIDRVGGDNERRAYIEDDTGDYVQPSDQRLKTGIQKIKNILPKINQLEAVSYQYKSKKENSRRTLGFLAQEVEKVLPELVHYGENGELGLAYSEFAVLAIQAIQEQQDLIEKADLEKDELLNKLELQEEKFGALNERLMALEQNLMSCCLQSQNNKSPELKLDSSSEILNQDRAQLQQNFPNPFHHQTEIRYYLPNNVQSAVLLISDMNGKSLKTYKLSGNGIGKINIEGKQFAAGFYTYSLVVNDKLVDSKQMVLTD